MKKIELTQTLTDILTEYIDSSKDEEKINYIKNLLESNQPGATEELTEKNQKILTWMKEAKDICNNTFSAKQIGDGLFMSGRAVSGSIRKLVTLGLVKKIDNNPVLYSLTDIT